VVKKLGNARPHINRCRQYGKPSVADLEWAIIFQVNIVRKIAGFFNHIYAPFM
jgi:hypothetical protein